VNVPTNALRGLKTVISRRGPGYLGYLVTDVVVPRLAYNFVWGPAAPAPLRAAFTRTAVTLSTTVYGEPPATGPAETALDRFHRRRITGVRHGFTRRAGKLRRHPDNGAAFRAERDADRCAFNDEFGAAILTEASARALLRASAARVTNGYKDYAPIDFGGGLTLGRFVTTDSGTGRWDAFNRHVVAPLVRGARVLDLGCNNGSLPLMMLREGAAAVVGIEGTPEIADLARANARILSWRDIRRYQFAVTTGDMRLCLDWDLSAFDVITAFCSLYYLPEADMARIIAKAAASGATLVLQANEAIDNLPARAVDLRRLMAANGYPDVTLHQFAGFGRPLLVGRRQAARQ
jgi:SAM-dependent methyltransferase